MSSDNNQPSLPRIIIKYVPRINIKINQPQTISQRSIGCNTELTIVQQESEQQQKQRKYEEKDNDLQLDNIIPIESVIREAEAEQRFIDSIEDSL